MRHPENGNGPSGRVASAQAAARAATQRLERVSQSRLEELMRLSPRARLDHIDDAALVLNDRVKLRRSVGAQLPIKRLRWRWRRFWLLRRSGLDRLTQETFATGLVFGTLSVLFVAAGWWTTATAFVLREPEEINIRMPEGGILRLKIPAGAKFGAQQRDGIWIQRLWIPGRGYAWTQLYTRSSSQ